MDHHTRMDITQRFKIFSDSGGLNVSGAFWSMRTITIEACYPGFTVSAKDCEICQRQPVARLRQTYFLRFILNTINEKWLLNTCVDIMPNVHAQDVLNMIVNCRPITRFGFLSTNPTVPQYLPVVEFICRLQPVGNDSCTGDSSRLLQKSS